MPATPHVESHFTASASVRDVVIGMADGLTVPFALAAGISGAVAGSANATAKTPMMPPSFRTLARRSRALTAVPAPAHRRDLAGGRSGPRSG